MAVLYCMKLHQACNGEPLFNHCSKHMKTEVYQTRNPGEGLHCAKWRHVRLQGGVYIQYQSSNARRSGLRWVAPPRPPCPCLLLSAALHRRIVSPPPPLLLTTTSPPTGSLLPLYYWICDEGGRGAGQKGRTGQGRDEEKREMGKKKKVTHSH